MKLRKFKPHDIKTLPLPHSSGSGEQWVRKRYPEELKVIRRRENAYLIVVIDADTGDTADRHQQLETECRENGVSPRDHKDANVLHIIPRRNIETWLAYLDGMDIDESKDYPKLEREGDCETHAKSLYNMCHRDQKLREPAPDSLQEACREYRKLQR
ncbi:MAG: hypothetical protein OXF25_06220 [Cyanobacteria bacterium MAG CAR3_bin_5]|nr:hypothetical protein [Cyanobacteria bacterium MAG CAR3_bin_5]MCY4235444.1 hypothetical protein [Cyanobacteria bacterium MAG CAR2_bin_4]